MSDQKSWLSSLSREAAREAFSNLIWSYWPVWGAPVIGAFLAWLPGLPLLYVFLSALFSFALIGIALNQISQWQTARTPENKVHINKHVLGVKLLDGDGSPKVQGFKLGVSAINKAAFPVEVRIDKLDTKIGTTVPSEEFFTRSVVVNGGGDCQFGNSLIDLSHLDLPSKTMIGQITAKISYGRPGKLKYSDTQHVWIAIKFDANGGLQAAEASHTELTA